MVCRAMWHGLWEIWRTRGIGLVRASEALKMAVAAHWGDAANILFTVPVSPVAGAATIGYRRQAM
jgi:hypothetical protein